MASSTRREAVVRPTEIITREGEMMEVALHRASGPMARDLDYYLEPFSTISSIRAAEVLILTTCQRSKVDLLSWDEDAAGEKDRLLFVFAAFAQEMCQQLRSRGFWADYADPASGLLVSSPGQRVWSEIQALERLRGYRLGPAGNCQILLHPRWGSRMYPATMFTSAPEHLVVELLFNK